MEEVKLCPSCCEKEDTDVEEDIDGGDVTVVDVATSVVVVVKDVLLWVMVASAVFCCNWIKTF